MLALYALRASDAPPPACAPRPRAPLLPQELNGVVAEIVTAKKAAFDAAVRPAAGAGARPGAGAGARPLGKVTGRSDRPGRSPGP